MLNAAEFLYFQIVISKSTRYDVNHRNSVTAPSVSHRESLYGDPSSYTGQKHCSHRQEHGMVFRSPVRHPIVEPQGYFHEVDLSVCCTNSNHAGAPLQNWTNKYTVIYLNGYRACSLILGYCVSILYISTYCDSIVSTIEWSRTSGDKLIRTLRRTKAPCFHSQANCTGLAVHPHFWSHYLGKFSHLTLEVRFI